MKNGLWRRLDCEHGESISAGNSWEGRGPPSYFPRICISRLIAHVLMRRLATVEATALPAIYSPSETTALFPFFGKSILKISKNSSACADTHIGLEENYI